MPTIEINAQDAIMVDASVGLSAVLVKAEGTVTNPPAPPAPPSLGGKLMRIINAGLTADRIASAIERWWPPVRDLGKELLDKMLRRLHRGSGVPTIHVAPVPVGGGHASGSAITGYFAADAILAEEPPTPPAPPPSIGRKLMRLINGLLTADRLAQVGERWWPTVRDFVRDRWDQVQFRRPATTPPA